MSVGERLRRARLDAGKTLDQLSADTKIQLWILDAIERDDFSRVPGGVFIRGYLTAFARGVGLNPSEILRAHSPEIAPQPAPSPPPPVLPPPDPHEVTRTPVWQYAVIVAMVLAAVALWRNMTRADREIAAIPTSPPPISAPPTPVPPPAQPLASEQLPTESGATATTGAAPAATPAEPHEGDPAAVTNAPLVVQVHANNEVWIEADADGERKVYQLFEQGQELRLEGQKEIRLLVGDAA